MTEKTTTKPEANVKIKFTRDTTKLEWDDLYKAGDEKSVVQDEADHWLRLGAAEIVNGDDKNKAAAPKK